MADDEAEHVASFGTLWNMEWYIVACLLANALLQMQENGTSSDVWSMAVLCCCVTVENST